MNILPLLVIALIIVRIVVRTMRRRGIPTVAPAEVRDAIKDRNVLVLDVRTAAEVSRGKMKGAMHIPLHELSGRIGELESHREKRIVVVCATGSRSLSGARILVRSGFQAASMTGGMMAWGS